MRRGSQAVRGGEALTLTRPWAQGGGRKGATALSPLPPPRSVVVLSPPPSPSPFPPPPPPFRADHINPGFLTYRKSVAEGQGFAAIEWRDGTPGGATVLDASGREYIDCLGGYGCYNVGHSHPVVVDAVRTQLAKQPLHSQELLDPLRGYCAALLAKTMPRPSGLHANDPDAVLNYSFFTNSGTESVEACLKMAMLATGRRHFVGLLGAFHGKTLGSLSGTSKAVFRTPFGGGLLPFSHVKVNDVDALRAVFASAKFTGSEIAGVLVEPVLGEGGIYVLSDAFLRAAREECDKSGALLIFDEVQSGMGRTGRMWACEWSGVSPDLMAVGKAFGGGVTAAGACVGNTRAWRKYFDNPFLHTTTFGGNPLAMAASIATLHVLRSERLVERAEETGDYLLAGLRALQARHPATVVDVRGRGLMLGLEFPDNDVGFAFSRGVFSRGVLLSGTLVNARTIRVEPPLTITREQVDAVLAIFGEVLDGMQGGAAARVTTAAATTAAAVAAATTAAAADRLALLGHNGAGGGAAARRPSVESAGSSDTDPDPFGEGSSAAGRPAASSSSSSSSAAGAGGRRGAALGLARLGGGAGGGGGGVSVPPSGPVSVSASPTQSESEDTDDAAGHDDEDEEERQAAK